MTQDFKAWIDQAKMPKGKKKVVLAALKLFAEQGFDGTSTAEIAEESGMSQATIFKYFKTKEELLDFIITPILENIVPIYVVEFKNQLAGKQMDLENLIHFVVRNRYQFLVDNQEVALIVISQVLTKDDVKEHFVSMITKRGPSIIQTFSNLMDSTHEIRSDLQPVEIMRLIVSQVLVYFIQNYKILPGRKPNEVDQDLTKIESMIINAIKKPAK